MAISARVRFKVHGSPYDIRLGDLTPQDAGDFRRAVGVPLGHAFSPAMDLDVIAGLMWLTRRKQNRNLSYAEVAESFTYDDFERADPESPLAPDGEQDGLDPPA